MKRFFGKIAAWLKGSGAKGFVATIDGKQYKSGFVHLVEGFEMLAPLLRITGKEKVAFRVHRFVPGIDATGNTTYHYASDEEDTFGWVVEDPEHLSPLTYYVDAAGKPYRRGTRDKRNSRFIQPLHRGMIDGGNEIDTLEKLVRAMIEHPSPQPERSTIQPCQTAPNHMRGRGQFAFIGSRNYHHEIFVTLVGGDQRRTPDSHQFGRAQAAYTSAESFSCISWCMSTTARMQRPMKSTSSETPAA